MKKRFCVFCIFIFALVQLYASGVLAYPRKINLLKTQHFDILYPDESETVAVYIAENSEAFFAEAQYHLETENNFRMPVVISPDSEKLSIHYSSYPYNRLIVFDGVPEKSQLGFEDVFGSMLYREIYLAVAQSKMSPFNQLIHDTVGGEKYTPVSLFNLPASFIDGYGDLVQSQYDYQKHNDGYYLQLLSEAKIEGKFPTWFQFFATRDTYPGDIISQAAGAAFSAFLIQSRGIEKYNQLWGECGKIHPFFAAGIIYKVYGMKVSELWEEFEEAIPLPATLETMTALENDVEKLFEYAESVYNNLVYSDFGIIWYDELRHEVDIFDFDQKTIFPNMRKLQKKLFSAEGVSRLSVSPDGRYLSVSFVQSKKSNNIQKNITWIYDLMEKAFIEDVYKVRDASIIGLPDGKNGVAGINVEEKLPKLQVYSSRNFGSQKNELIYEAYFTEDKIPLSPVFAGDGKVMYILAEAEKTTLRMLDINSSHEQVFTLTDLNNTPLKISNLVYQNTGMQGNFQDIYSFQYSSREENSLVRTGSFILDEGNIAAVSLQENDITGGVNFPVFYEENVVFSSQRLFHDELEIIASEKLGFQPGTIINEEENLVVNEYAELFLDELDLSEYNVSKYSLLTYWHRFSIVPFLPIKEISFEGGQDSELGLGAQVKLVPDPFMNNKLTISAAWSFLDLDFVWMLNAPTEEEKIIDKDEQKLSKDKTFAFFYENTSTPVDLKAGALYRFNKNGEYEFTALSGISWTLPLGFTFNELAFDIYSEYIVSTEYYDVNLTDIYLPKDNFPGFSDAYELGKLSASIKFSNIHQFGKSGFQKKGFYAGVKVYSVWDIFKYRNQQESENFVSQLFLGLNGGVAVPQLIPLKPNKDGWILGLPASASVEVAPEAGTVLNTNAEVLLFGKEIQDGFPYINLYFNRIGLKTGYNLSLKYDTTSIKLPDFRRFDYMYDIFNASKANNSFYVLLNLDFLFPIGPLSQKIISSRFKTTFFPDTGGFTFNLDFSLNF